MSISTQLGLPRVRHHVPLVVALGVDAVGSGISGPLLLLFLIRVIGLELGTAGLLMSSTAVISLLVPALVSHVTVRVGARTIVIAAQVVQGIGMAALLIARDVPTVAIALTAVAVGQRAFWSSVFSLVAAAADDEPASERGRWFAASGMIQNAGFGLGGLAAGGLLLLPGAAPYLAALAVNAASFFVSAWLFKRERVRTDPRADEPRGRTRVWSDTRYLALTAGNTLFAFCSMLLAVGLPVFALEVLGTPAWLVGPLLALTTVIGATCQGLGVRATRSWRRTSVLSLAGGIWIGWGLLMGALPLVGAVWMIAGLVVCVVCYAVAELLHAPASMTVAASQAPTTARESYLSWFQYSFALASVLTPSVFASLTEIDGSLPWLVGSGAAAVAIVLTRATVRDGQASSRRITHRGR